MMGKWMLLAALAATLILSGCAGRGRSARPAGPGVSGYGAVIAAGTKPASAVEPCCRDLATGRIPLAQCMAKRECKAKGNNCCMNAVNDLPARL